jgi:APA family basic amino acid/polyamine antiporter
MTVSGSFGSGIFFSVSQTAGQVPDAATIFWVWLAGGLISLTGSITFSEVGGRFPETGGIYTYLRHTSGNLIAFLYGWASLLVITTGAIAALAIVFVNNLSVFVALEPWMRPCLAAGLIVLLSAVNMMSNKLAAALTGAGTLLKMAGVTVIVVTGLLLAGQPVSRPVETVPYNFSWLSFGMAMIGAMWAYGGWHHSAALAGELENSGKKLPGILLTGTVLITLIYLSVNWAYLSVMQPQQLAQSESPAVDIMSAFVPWAAAGMALLIALSVLVTAGVYMVSSPRVYYKMAEDGLFFRWLSVVHPRTGTPVRAIAVQAIWSIVLVLGWQQFSRAIEYVTITDWVFLLLTGFGVFVLRRRSGVPAGYTVPLYPVVPLLFSLAVCLFIAAAMWMQPRLAMAFLAVMVSGCGAFVLYRRYRC